MPAVVRKSFLALVTILVLVGTSAWQAPAVLAQSPRAGLPETPLYLGLTWSPAVAATQEIRVNTQGGSLALAGRRYTAAEQFAALPEALLSYYSNAALAPAGWESYDAFQDAGGSHFVFLHEGGLYLSVDFLSCAADPGSTCLSVWQSDPAQPVAGPRTLASPQAQTATATTTFGKTAPSNGATGLNPTSTTLSWEAYPNADKYKFCLKIDSECAESDPNWTSTYSRSVLVTVLSSNKTYYWQVRATTCETCVPKNWVYANNGTPWKFSTKAGAQVTILGNAGVGSATLSYSDGSLKTVKADSTGAYSLTVPQGWTGTVTPSKAGYLFSPASASFNNLTASQTIQNFAAIPAYTISGNVGLAGVTLSYTNGSPLTVTSDASGNYAITVQAGWSGTITPSKLSYSFTPPNRSYTNVAANQTLQNYTPTFITYTISGNAGAAYATMTYNNNGPQFVMADGTGFYSITVPFGWTGTVIPYRLTTSFSPANRPYNSLSANQTGQNFTASNCASCADIDTTGVFRPSNGLLFLKNLNVSGFADISINYGIPGDYPVVGDWDGNGTTTIGVFRGGTFYLRNSNTVGIADVFFPFGSASDQPIAGDWDGNGTDTVGVYRSSTGTFFLRNTNSTGAPDLTFQLGMPGDVAIAGDWNGDGIDTVGVFRPSNGVIYLKNSNDTTPADVNFNYGIAGDKPVAGDWNNDGKDTIGIYRNGLFYLRNTNTAGAADLIFALGLPGDVPIAGNWDNKP